MTRHRGSDTLSLFSRWLMSSQLMYAVQFSLRPPVLPPPWQAPDTLSEFPFAGLREVLTSVRIGSMVYRFVHALHAIYISSAKKYVVHSLPYSGEGASAGEARANWSSALVRALLALRATPPQDLSETEARELGVILAVLDLPHYESQLPLVAMNTNPIDGSPGELFWVAGRTVCPLATIPHAVEVRLNGLEWSRPFCFLLDSETVWLRQPGQFFEAQINLECRGPEALCALNPRPLGTGQETAQTIWARLEQRAHPMTPSGE